MCPPKMAEGIEVLFWIETPGGQRNIVVDGDLDPPMARGGVVWENFVHSLYCEG